MSGTPYWDVRNSNESQSFAALAGQPTIDLSSLTPAGPGPAVVDVWLGLGQTRVIVPRDEPVRIDANVLIGSIEYTGLADGRDRGALFLHDSRVINPDNTYHGNLPLMRIWTVIGQISITDDAR